MVDASVACGLCFLIIIAIMVSIFISNLIQISSQWELIITIMVPSIPVVSIIIKMIGFISTGRI